MKTEPSPVLPAGNPASWMETFAKIFADYAAFSG